MTDKLVTHEDLAVLRDLRNSEGFYDGDAADALLNRLIAAAEADVPPLPEGWVLATFGDGGRQPLYHRDGGFFIKDDGSLPIPLTAEERDRLTPLRPTVTEADVEKAAASIRDQLVSWAADVPSWDEIAVSDRAHYRRLAIAAFTAAGIEVQP